MKNITIGQYLPGTSFIHRLDPRLKLLTAIGLIGLLFLIKSISGYLVFTPFISLIILLSRIPGSFVLKGLKPMLPFLFIMWCFQILFYRGEGLQFFLELGPVQASWQGLYFGGLMLIRVLFLFLITSLLTLTTSLMDLTGGLESLLRPLQRLGFPAQEVTLVMVISLRFVPTLAEELEKIMKAQLSRGVEFDEGNFLVRTKKIFPVFLPLFLNAFRRGEDLVVAMDSRCYRGGRGRGRLRTLTFSSLDRQALFFLLLFLLLFIPSLFLFLNYLF